MTLRAATAALAAVLLAIPLAGAAERPLLPGIGAFGRRVAVAKMQSRRRSQGKPRIAGEARAAPQPQ
jgi:hypothetical protein